MMNALRAPQSVLVLGGTSEIADAIVRQFPASRLTKVLLAGRPGPGLDHALTRTATYLQSKGSEATVAQIGFDSLDTEGHQALLDEAFATDIDVVILAFGVLGDQEEFEQDSAAAVEAARANYVGAVSTGLIVAEKFKEQGHGTLIVLSSVAGLRGRRSNYVYGSTKAGLDVFAQGLGDALADTGAHVLVVRPGFVRTKMTKGLPEAPLAVTPERVALDTIKGLRRSAHTVHSPPAIAAVFVGLRALPRSIFRKLSL
jgi:decaprenylphospho-beta-D-erythro-pentofuranosid-2-ulose 2-reductase